ncbi:MAG TPA: ABC transporter substrate-binding protein, partial [Vineibacter sp.]|nr:ABC transporter substrate-binding protein [Vineibacter sp.]
MRRRHALSLLLGAVAGVSPAATWAQTRTPRLGILFVGNPEPHLRQFRDGLRQLGYVDGRTVQLDVRTAEGQLDRLPVLAAEFVARKVDVIVAFQTPAVTAAKGATSDIPIVMASAGDPVATGLVASLARPGGNITGMSSTSAELGGKLMELVREMLPPARRVAVLANATDP